MMINYLAGKVLIKEKNFILLEKNGIGFKVFLSEKNLEKIKKGEEIKLFCSLLIRGQNLELYGFLNIEQLKVFEALEKISGIGPKAALTIASLGSLEELKKAIENKDFKYFQKIKGIGRKKIQKIILEIGGKIEKIGPSFLKQDQALEALVSLGFTAKEAKEALSKVPEEIKELQERIKKALQILGRG
jgi:Holliday junction DNA helicase RuvA